MIRTHGRKIGEHNTPRLSKMNELKLQEHELKRELWKKSIGYFGKTPEFNEVIYKNKTWKVSWTGNHGAKTPTEIRIEKLTAPCPSCGGIDYFIMIDGKLAGNHASGWIPDYIKEKAIAAFKKRK